MSEEEKEELSYSTKLALTDSKNPMFMPHFEEWDDPSKKALFSSLFSIGEVVTFQAHEGDGGQLPAIISRVIFEMPKVRYDLITLNGGIFEGVYSQRILPLTEENRRWAEDEENEGWVQEIREEYVDKG
jgi:hypothetical protein